MNENYWLKMNILRFEMGGGVEEEGAGMYDIGHWKFWLIKAFPPSETLIKICANVFLHQSLN